MVCFTFQITDLSITDPRKHQKENCMFFFFYPRDYDELFTERKQISDYLKKQIQLESIEDLTENWFETFQDEFKKFMLNLKLNMN